MLYGRYDCKAAIALFGCDNNDVKDACKSSCGLCLGNNNLVPLLRSKIITFAIGRCDSVL